MIYKRFTEKAADEWRQIYKALQLLEFLIKNGSERVIDDARSHLTLLKMLRQFHFIDANGKDQGINVRNRAKELTELLSDVERIRTERKKARATRQKYTGVEGGAGLGGGSSRFGGFGSEEHGDFGGYSGGVFGDGGGFGGQQSGNDYEPSRAGGSGGGDRFEEYDEYDEGVASPSSRRRAEPTRTTQRAGTERSTAPKPKPAAAPPKPKAPEVDLFSFDEPSPALGLSTVAPASHALAPAADDDDDFDDFQSAAPPPSAPATTSTTNSYTQFASPQPVSAPKQADLSSMMGAASLSPTPSSTSTPVNYSAFSIPAAAPAAQPLRPQPAQTTSYQSAQPNYFTSVKSPGAPSTSGAPLTATSTGSGTATGGAAPKKAGGDAFGNLWSTASAGVKKSSAPAQGPALGQLAREKATQGIWGAGAPKAQSGSVGGGNASGGGSGLDDLLG